MSKGASIKYSPDELAFIQVNATLSRAALTQLFNATFNRDIAVDNIKALCTRKGWKTGRDGRFPKGSVPPNKGTKGLTGANSGSFKKGQQSHTQKPVGYERTTVDGYIEVKVAEPNKFRAKHHIIYEQHFGTIPAGHVVKFKDGNPQNLATDNLVLMSRGELAVLNHLYDHKNAPDEAKPVLITLAKVKAKIGTIKRKATSEVASQ